MPGRHVYWYEGMFLQPHHFQAAERDTREALRASEDWHHPFNWGIRSLDLDRDAIGNYAAVLRSCEARFKDGTKLSIPADAEVDPVELKGALTDSGETFLYLAVPTLHRGRANVEPRPTADGPRYWVDTVEMEDENTGEGDQTIEVRRVRARILLSGQDQTGYEVIPLARVFRSAQAESPPQLDASYVPPLLVMDAWTPLWRKVQALHYQMGAVIEQLSSQVVGRGISFDSQVPGDAESLLKLAAVNGAFSHLQAVGYVRGLTPLAIYGELCRTAGQLAIFTDARRPPNLPAYDHDDLGGCFRTVIEFIDRALKTFPRAAFVKRYFERSGERLESALEQDWIAGQKAMYLGVESELTNQECQALLDAMDMKLGSGGQVDQIFRQRLQGLKLVPVTRPPRALPASAGTTYYQVERDPVFWRDVAASNTLGLRLNLARATFQSERILAVPGPGGKTANLQFALFVV